ncbi:MAG: hypothetical protein PQ612_06375 [Rickettsiales bacterium]|nr:hypothetical protein [Pseudomonadota bacterium]MDA0966597.1 hypothetical protein [Pseudomonadota bacterium]MDG4543626.1 hypothetical protein [Rickettsiales bacterium]MDG4545773.1 hypothetical protein [Rickettsiales bacterium]MDG4547454.1 hypothetical protein [Rickettsiales bacterium]
MAKELTQSPKLPAFIAMNNEDKKRTREMDYILSAPDDIIPPEEKEKLAEALLLKYEKQADHLEKWNNFIQLDCKGFEEVVFKIEAEAPYKHKTLLIFNLLLNSIDRKGKSLYTAKSLSEKLDCHINMVYQSLKWLRENDIIVDKKDTKDRGIYIM